MCHCPIAALLAGALARECVCVMGGGVAGEGGGLAKCLEFSSA